MVELATGLITYAGSPAEMVIIRDITDRKQAENAVRESEEKFRSVLEHSPDIIFIVDRQMRIQFINRAPSGLAIDSVLGTSYLDYVHTGDRATVETVIQQVFETGEPSSYEIQARGTNDALAWYATRIALMKNKVGKQRALLITTDITERKRTEETIMENEGRYRRLVEHSPYGVVIHIQGQVVYGNPTAVTLIGAKTLDEMLGKPVIDIVHPDSRPAVIQRLREMSEGKEVPLLQEKFICFDGRVIDVEVIAYPFSYQNKPAVQVVFNDVTERKRAETAILKQAETMTTLYETTRDLVVVRDLSTLLQTIVERAARLLNASGGGLYLCEPEQNRVRCVVSYNTLRNYTGTVLKYGEGAAGRVAETGEPLIVDDYRIWDERAHIYEQDRPFISLLSVPIRWQDRVTGVIRVLENAVPRVFTQADLQVLTLFANQAAIAIENVRLFESEQHRIQEAAVIAEVSRDISASLHLEDVLERIATNAKKLLQAETSAVYLLESKKTTLRAIAAIGPDADEIKGDPLIIGEGILGNIALQKVGEIVNDTVQNPNAIIIKGTENIPDEHIMGVPVLSESRLTGLIAVWRRGETREFRAAELDFLSNLAQQVGVAIENARLFEAEQHRRQEADTLRQAAQRITSTLDQEQAIQLILEQLAKVVQYESASVQLLRDGYLEIVGGQGWPDPSVVLGMRFPIPGDNPNSIVVLERRPVALRSASEDFSPFNTPPHSHIRSWLGVPLIVRDHVIGMFAVDHSQPDYFTQADVEMVNAFAGQAAITIENTRLFEETCRQLAELEIIQTIASALRIAQKVDDVFPIILDQLINLLDFGTALVDLIELDSGEIVTILAHGVWAPMTGKRTPINAGGSGRVIASGRPYVTTDVIADGVVAHPDLIGGLNAAVCVPIVAQRQTLGTLWVGRRSRSSITGEEINLLLALGEMVGSTIQRMTLHEQTVLQAEEIESAYDLTLEGWAKALELRDKETEGHSRRVSDLTLQLARQFGFSPTELVHIRRGVLLHDIGKMGVSDQILKKRGPLNDEEWAEMRKHPQYAYDLIFPIAYLRPTLDIPYCHHERWDGSGYPRGLKGEQIPQAARIFSVIDVYDALSNDRPYRSAWLPEKVLDYLRDQSGKLFDPRIVEAVLHILAEA